MFHMGEETMGLPLEEKMKYEQGDDGMSFGRVPFVLGKGFRLTHDALQVQSSRRKRDR